MKNHTNLQVIIKLFRHFKYILPYEKQYVIKIQLNFKILIEHINLTLISNKIHKFTYNDSIQTLFYYTPNYFTFQIYLLLGKLNSLQLY